MADKIVKSDEEWRRELTEEQYQVTRQKGTERAFTGEYCHNKDRGVYHCVCCGNELFSSDAKFESGSGWPSFWQPLASGKVAEETDSSQAWCGPRRFAASATPIWVTSSPMVPSRRACATA